MSQRFYPAVIVELSEDDGGGFLAFAPDLYGCMSDGETVAEAIENLSDAIREWCDEMTRLGREIPEPGSSAKRVSEEREELIALVVKQGELLDEQGEAFGRLEKDLINIKARVQSLMERAQEHSPGLDVTWPAGANIATLVAASRTSSDLPH